MPTYGLTDKGFVLPRLSDILEQQRQEAREIFGDLVSPGDQVDVSDSSLLGRLIALDSIGDADLWEVAQMIYSAFDPNSATGIALDNIVQYGGITRSRGTYTTASVILSGDVNTLIPAGSTVLASDTNTRFTLTQSVGLSPNTASGVSVVVNNVVTSNTYQITYTGLSTSRVVTYVASSGHTVTDVLSGLLAEIQANHPELTAQVVSNRLDILKTDIFQSSNFTTSSNLIISKIKKVGEVSADELGPFTQQANSITTISTPVLGWDSVYNPLPAAEGRLVETDEELRQRFRVSKFEKATNILDALYSALIAVSGVQRVVIYENDTSTTDTNGLPPHSFMPIVLGGVSDSIGAAIWENKPIGIQSYGNTSVTVVDIQGFPHIVSFERPNPVDVYISINLTTDGDYPENGDDLIKAALINYFNENFNIGDDVIYSRLYTAINSVPGHQVNSLTIGTSPSPTGMSNIAIAFNQISNLSDTNIIITS